MKMRCFFLVFLACVLAGCGSSENLYGFTWAISTVAFTGYDASKCALMRHVYAAPGATLPDFETVIEKTEKTKSVNPEFNPSPNAITDHAFLFKYEGRKAIYYGRFVQETNNQSELLPTFPAGEITNLASFVAKLKSPPDPVSTFLISRFSESTRLAIAGFPKSHVDEKTLEPLLVKELNAIILGPSIYEEDRFREVRLPPVTLHLLKLDLDPPPGMRISRRQMTAVLNRMLLEDAYPSNLPLTRESKMRNYVAIKY
jgi:hypothetical protein